jgi:hypothetical protein
MTFSIIFFLEANNCTHRKFCTFQWSDGSLPPSQEQTIQLSPKPHESILHPQALFLSDLSHYSPCCSYILQVTLFIQEFKQMHFWSFLCLLNVMLIAWCFIIPYRGKQWQTTLKNLPRMQHARAIPFAWLGSGSCQNRPKGRILMMVIP